MHGTAQLEHDRCKAVHNQRGSGGADRGEASGHTGCKILAIPGQKALENLRLLGYIMYVCSMKGSKALSNTCSIALFTHLLRFQGSHMDP